ncbi:MAG: hypothetical protein ACLQM6_08600 [Acidobacteriaceae bacterium]
MASGIMWYVVGGGPPTTNAPFSATIQTTHEQKFVDGNVIHGLIITHAYRDSAGRTRGETSGLCNIGPDDQLRPTFTISVDDPATRTTLSWEVNGTGDKVVSVYHQPDPKTAAAAAPPLTEQQRQRIAQLQEHTRKYTRKEKLGSKMIAGVMTDGSRQTTTIPAGEQGNDRPIVTTDEFWITRDSTTTMLRIQDDPRVGHTVTEVTERIQGEPDPSLFAPPPGYKLVEQVRTTKPVAPAQ